MSDKMAECKNYRPNVNRFQMPGACLAHTGQVIADLYEDGKFVREAVVADVGARGLAGAQRYCEEQERRLREEASDSGVPAAML